MKRSTSQSLLVLNTVMLIFITMYVIKQWCQGSARYGNMRDTRGMRGRDRDTRGRGMRGRGMRCMRSRGTDMRSMKIMKNTIPFSTTCTLSETPVVWNNNWSSNNDKDLAYKC